MSESVRRPVEAQRGSPPKKSSSVSSRASRFVVVFLAEWGDLTQVATANLAAKYAQPVAVAAGATLALWSVAALAVTAGDRLLRRVPVTLVRRLSAALLAVLAVATLIDAAHG
jgi:putative Ca2+/H+ antiporter (TMEM165/GDT1 family)